MEKTNLSKRVVAGTLALLTVFGSAPASLQGVFAPSTLTASATNYTKYYLNLGSIMPEVDDELVTDNLVSVKIGNKSYTAEDFAVTGATYNIAANTAVEVKTKVKLAIDSYGLKEDDTIDTVNSIVKGTLADGVYTYKFTTADNYTDIDVDVVTTNYTATSSVENVVVEYDCVDGYVGRLEQPLSATATNLNDVALGSTIKVVSEKPIAVEINNNAAGQNLDRPAMKFVDGKYVVEIPAVESATDAPVILTVSEATEDITFTASGRKVTATTPSGSFNNSTVAELAVTKYDATAGEWVEFADNGAIDYATDANAGVVVRTSVANVLTAESITVTRDGTAITQDDMSKTIDTTNANVAGLKFTQSGTYVVTYKVKNAKAGATDSYEVKATFKINEVAPLTADDFVYTLTANDGATKVSDVEIKNGLVTFEIPANDEIKNAFAAGQFTITAKQKAPSATYTKLQYGHTIVANDYTGSKSGSTLDTEYTVKIELPTDGVYKANELTVKWKAVQLEEEVEPEWNDLYNDTVTLERLSTLEAELRDKFAGNDAAKAVKGDLKFEYVTGLGAPINIKNLDGRESGVPTTYVEENTDQVSVADSKNVYTIYALYEGKTVAAEYVRLTEVDATPVAVKLADKTITYGDWIGISDVSIFGETEDPDTHEKAIDEDTTITGADGKVVMNLEAVRIYELVEWQTEDGSDNVVATIDGKKYKKKGEAVNNNEYIADDQNETYADPTDDKFTLPAGKYIIENIGASVLPAYAEAYTASTAKTSAVVVVNKKKLTADMVKITPFSWVDGTKYNVVNAVQSAGATVESGMVYAVDADDPYNNSISVKVTEGSSQTKVGTYTDAKVEVTSDEANYEGSVSNVPWMIVNKDNGTLYTDAEDHKTVVWWGEGASIKSNGELRFDIERAADDKLPETNGTKRTVAKFGVVLDKNGYVNDGYGYNLPVAADDEDNNYGVAYNANPDAAGKLLVGAGLTEGSAKDPTSQTYGFAVTVTDVNQVVYARPYVLYDDNTVDYGPVRRFTLQEQATALLNLKTAGMDRVTAYTAADVRTWNADAANANAQKSADNIRAGYLPANNAYYVYATFDQIEKTQNLTLEVSKFGVVVDKKGVFGSRYIYGGYDENGTSVADGLKLGNGFIQGNYNPKSTVLKDYEYGAKITPQDTVTGVWVRAYVDLGNGLVVYTKPMYIPSVSELYGGSNVDFDVYEYNEKRQCGVTMDADDVNQLKATIIAASNNGVENTLTDADVVLVRTGVVVVKDLAAPVRPTDYQSELDMIAWMKKVYAMTVNTAGAIVDSNDAVNGVAEDYIGIVTRTDGKALAARGFAEFTIKGVSVIVYTSVRGSTGDGQIMPYYWWG